MLCIRRILPSVQDRLFFISLAFRGGAVNFFLIASGLSPYISQTSGQTADGLHILLQLLRDYLQAFPTGELFLYQLGQLVFAALL